MDDWVPYDAGITPERKQLILSYLDGWILNSSNTKEDKKDYEECNAPPINPFVPEEELINHTANKIITDVEIENAYYFALDKALTHTNRLNIDNLTKVEGDLFCKYVCVWTASDLWNKYNIRVNNEDMEDTYVQSYGGILYQQALNGLAPFILQKVQGFHAIDKRRKLKEDSYYPYGG